MHSLPELERVRASSTDGSESTAPQMRLGQTGERSPFAFVDRTGVDPTPSKTRKDARARARLSGRVPSPTLEELVLPERAPKGTAAQLSEREMARREHERLSAKLDVVGHRASKERDKVEGRLRELEAAVEEAKKVLGRHSVDYGNLVGLIVGSLVEDVSWLLEENGRLEKGMQERDDAIQTLREGWREAVKGITDENSRLTSQLSSLTEELARIKSENEGLRAELARSHRRPSFTSKDGSVVRESIPSMNADHWESREEFSFAQSHLSPGDDDHLGDRSSQHSVPL